MKKLLLIAALLSIATAVQAGDCYSEGVRVGVVQKFSQKGFVNKSWEGEMVQEGDRVRAAGNGAAVTNIWKFSTLDPAIAKQLDQAVFDGAPVAVRYCQKAPFALAGQTDTSYLIVGVRARK